jgi:phosphatidylglycerophosphate synthase
VSHDTWIHRVVRPAVVPLVNTRVTPNQLTTVRLVTGLAAATVAAQGTRGWLALAGAVFLVSMLFDRADGVLARLSGKSSPFGHRYDLVTDTVCNAAIFLGIGAGLARGPLGAGALALGALAGAGIVAVLALVMRLEALRGARAGELGARAGFDPDDAMLVVPGALWLGAAAPLLWAAGVGAPLFALFFAWRFRGELRGAG